MKRSLSRSTDAISVTTFLAGTRHVDFLESYKRINPLDRVQTPKIFSCRTNCVSGSDQTKGPLADRLCPTRWPIVYTRRPSLFLGLLLHTPILPRLTSSQTYLAHVTYIHSIRKGCQLPLFSNVPVNRSGHLEWLHNWFMSPQYYIYIYILMHAWS